MAGSFYVGEVQASDYSGIWVIKSSGTQIVVNKSGAGYSIERTGFHRGKIVRYKGSMTVQGNTIFLKDYNSGISSTASVKDSRHFTESSTVKWRKVSNSTALPSFNLTGTWGENPSMTLKQSGTKLSGSDSKGNRLSGEIYGHIVYIDAISKSGYSFTHKYFAVNNSRLMIVSSSPKPFFIVKKSVDMGNSSATPSQGSVEGLWKSASPQLFLKMKTKGMKVLGKGFFLVKDKKFYFIAKGKLRKRHLKLKYKLIRTKPKGWGSRGSMLLIRSGDDKMLGWWKDSAHGKRGKIMLVK